MENIEQEQQAKIEDLKVIEERIATIEKQLGITDSQSVAYIQENLNILASHVTKFDFENVVKSYK